MSEVSYSLKIADGDLARKGSQLDLVFGLNKLNQDVDLWIRERYGIDRFHPSMGSILQDFIGGVVTGSTSAEVQGEILRILRNYQAIQHRRLKENPQLLSPSEVLVSIDDIVTRVDYDSVQVTIRLRNGSDTASTIKIGANL